MRYLGHLLVVAGVVALVMGIVATVHAAHTIPFDYEATNHVGQIVGALALIPIGVYLISLFKEQGDGR